jgi:hypothetical protein
MVGQSMTAEPHGIEAVRRFLARRGVPYELLEHDPTYSAAAEARAAGAELAATAKTVVLHDRDGYRLAVIPASERLDVHRAREPSAPATTSGWRPRRSCVRTSPPSSPAPGRRSGRRGCPSSWTSGSSATSRSCVRAASTDAR